LELLLRGLLLGWRHHHFEFRAVLDNVKYLFCLLRTLRRDILGQALDRVGVEHHVEHGPGYLVVLAAHTVVLLLVIIFVLLAVGRLHLAFGVDNSGLGDAIQRRPLHLLVSRHLNLRVDALGSVRDGLDHRLLYYLGCLRYPVALQLLLVLALGRDVLAHVYDDVSFWSPHGLQISINFIS